MLASARDQDIEVPVAQALAEASAGLIQDPQSDFFAETGVRIAALAGDEESAWAWLDTGGERMRRRLGIPLKVVVQPELPGHLRPSPCGRRIQFPPLWRSVRSVPAR